MSQRGSGQAPPPADNGLGRRLGRRAGYGGRSDPGTGFGREGRIPPTNGDFDDDLDPRELDRYLEDRARLAAPPPDAEPVSDRPSRSERDESPPSRWSSPARRRRREAVRLRPEEPTEAPLPPWTRAADSVLDPYPDEADRFDWDAEPVDADHGDWEVDEPTPPSRRRYPATRTSRRTARPRPAISVPSIRLPSSIAQSDLLRDPIALALLGGCGILAFVMALVMVSRLGDLPSVLVLREDAYGMPARWGPPKSLWQLPLLVTMVTVINLVLAAAISRYDRFASRFLLAAAFVVGVVAWVPVVRFLF